MLTQQSEGRIWTRNPPSGGQYCERIHNDPHSGALYIFRGRRGDLVKILFWDRQGMCLYAKKLDRGRFIWPQAKDGIVSLTMAQLSMLLESIDWRATAWTARPEVVV